MTDRTQDQQLKSLATEIILALTEIKEKRLGLNEEALRQSLAHRPGVKALLTPHVSGHAPNVHGPSKEPDIKVLQSQYVQLHSEMNAQLSKTKEIKDTYTKLAELLIRTLVKQAEPKARKTLVELNRAVQGDFNAFLIENSMQQLKFHLGHTESPGVGPEGAEENIRDILLALLREIAFMEDEEVRKKAKEIKEKLENEFTLVNYKPYVHEIRDLIFQHKEAFLREKKDIYHFIQELISRLDETANEILKALDSQHQRLGEDEEVFQGKVDHEMRQIEESFIEEGLSLDQVKTRVFGKIAEIREHFRDRRDKDAARLQQIENEKALVERRLQSIHLRYTRFHKRSLKMLEEMEKFRQASLRDGLTGVYNRRAYDLQIKQALEEIRKGGLARFTMIVIDIDYFKDFNTNYGHRAGDKVLQHVTKFSSEILRREDFLARYGGDEFVVILPETTLRTATIIAKKIRDGIFGIGFKVYRDHDLTVNLGLSMGVSAARTYDTQETIFQRADQALYLAKDRGRNQVCTEEDL